MLWLGRSFQSPWADPSGLFLRTPCPKLHPHRAPLWVPWMLLAEVVPVHECWSEAELSPAPGRPVCLVKLPLPSVPLRTSLLALGGVCAVPPPDFLAALRTNVEGSFLSTWKAEFRK